MPFARVVGSGSALPERVLTNSDLEKMVDTSDTWIVERTGIERRHIVTDETTTSLAACASKQALSVAGLQPEQIDLIIVATCTPQQWLPSTACIVQKILGCYRAAAFDLNAACSGFIYALSIADQYIRSGTYRHALVVGSDTLSQIIDWKDRSTCVLFGDGAGAVVVSADTEPGILSTHLYADGRQHHLLYTELIHRDQKACIKMTGNTVFRLAVSTLSDLVKQTLLCHGLTEQDLDWLVPHQANLRIIKAIAKKLELPMSRVAQTVREHGNTSSASVPLALDNILKKNKIKAGDLVMLEVFGAGLTWGSALMIHRS